jgi:hypothetical protein
MAIVWPCTLSVDAYAAAGKEVEVPRADCPSCLEPMTFWSGYSRFVRHKGTAHKIWVPRGQCGPCDVTHALLPGFVARNRLDSVETIGAALEPVVFGKNGVRPVAERLGVPTRHGARLAAQFRTAGCFAGWVLRRPRGRVGRRGADAVAGPETPRSRRHGRRLEGCLGTAGMAGGRSVAFLLVGVRRNARGHQHELPLSARRQTSFHASCQMTTTTDRR